MADLARLSDDVQQEFGRTFQPVKQSFDRLVIMTDKIQFLHGGIPEKKSFRNVLALLLLLGFSSLWRVLCGAVSSRYYAALIPLIVLLSAYVASGVWLKVRKRKICRLWLLAGVLFVAGCILKLERVPARSKAREIRQLSFEVQKLSAQYPKTILRDFSGWGTPVGYCSGIVCRDHIPGLKPGEWQTDETRRYWLLQRYTDCDLSIILVSKRHKEKIFSSIRKSCPEIILHEVPGEESRRWISAGYYLRPVKKLK